MYKNIKKVVIVLFLIIGFVYGLYLDASFRRFFSKNFFQNRVTNAISRIKSPRSIRSLFFAFRSFSRLFKNRITRTLFSKNSRLGNVLRRSKIKIATTGTSFFYAITTMQNNETGQHIILLSDLHRGSREISDTQQAELINLLKEIKESGKTVSVIVENMTTMFLE